MGDIARRRKNIMSSVCVSAAASLIVLACIISLNSKKLANFLITNVERNSNIGIMVEKIFGESAAGEANNHMAYDGPFTVKRVVDGDTFVVVIDDTDAKIKLIGVDAPDSASVANSDNKSKEEGKIASEYLKQLLADKELYLEYDEAKADAFGRILAYVFYEEEEQLIMVNQKLLSDGMAQLMIRQPNVKYIDLLTEAQASAREAGAGFWKNGGFNREN